mgnify:CR=1 FL=1
MKNTPTDQELSRLILAIEDELDAEGMDPKDRAFHGPQRVMSKLGYISFVMGGLGAPPVLERIMAIHRSLYRPKDTGVGGLHGGAFMFRGIATRIYIPIIFGRVGINPLDLCDLTDDQKRWLGSRDSDLNAYVDTFADLFDFAAMLAPMSNYSYPPEESVPLLTSASFQLQAAGAVLCNAFDERGCVQNALIGAELTLKGALKGKGVLEKELKGMGHDLPRLVEATAERWPSFDLEKASKVVAEFPPYVANRYSQAQPSRRDAGSIVMGAQFIAGETARAISGGNFRAGLTRTS